MKTLKSIVAYKTHFDIGYTDLAVNVLDYYSTTMIDEVLHLIDQNEGSVFDIKWTVPSWPLRQILNLNRDNEKYAKLCKAIGDGSIVCHALPFTMHIESMELEDLTRSLGWARELAEKFGQNAPIAAKMTDVPCHSWVLPTILSHSGIKFLHLGCNPASSCPDVPSLFWWEGPDGSRILTMYTQGDYGTEVTPDSKWPYKVWLAIMHTGDNLGAPCKPSIMQMIKSAMSKAPNLNIVPGTLCDFYREFIKDQYDLPVIRGDMPDTWIHGIMSMPTEVKLIRSLRSSFFTLESLNTLLKLSGVNIGPCDQQLADAYENSILFAEHTWGMDVKQFTENSKFHHKVTSSKARETDIPPSRPYGKAWQEVLKKGRYEKLEHSWQEQAQYPKNIQQAISKPLRDNLQALASNVSMNGKRIVVYNPLPWIREDIVSIETDLNSIALQDTSTGQAIPACCKDRMAIFKTTEVPALGYKTYKITQQPTQSTNDLCISGQNDYIENDYYKLQFDLHNCCLKSIYDKRNNLEFVDSKHTLGFGQYVYERFGKAEVDRFLNRYLKGEFEWALEDFGKVGLANESEVPYSICCAGSASMDIHQNDISVSAVLRPSSKSGFANTSLKVTLWAQCDFIDLEWSIEDKIADPWPEGGWLSFPINIKDPVFKMARLGSIVDPEKDIVDGSNRSIYCLNGGVSVLDRTQKFGMSLFPLDSPLISLGKPGLWDYQKNYNKYDPAVFVNLFNNQFSTNFTQWISGSWSSRVRLQTFKNFDPATDLINPSMEVRQPLSGHFFDGAKGSLPLVYDSFNFSRKGIVVTSMELLEDASKLQLRIWEMAGQESTCDIKLPNRLKAEEAYEVDLAKKMIGIKYTIKNNKFQVNLKPNAPTTIIFCL